MTTLPAAITRYTGANTFSAQDFHGNVFYAFQKQNDAGCVVMVAADGSSTEVLSIPSSGRPALECNPLAGLWAVGNKETGTRATPPRYPIVQYVPFPVGAQGPQGIPGPAGAPGAGGVMLFPTPIAPAAWSGRTLNGGVLVDVPTVFGVAPEAGYFIRLSATASAAGVITRAGTESAPYFVTLVSQVAGVRNDTQGWVPGPSIFVSTIGGEARVWLQLVGFSG
jgi:hypothetical protein